MEYRVAGAADAVTTCPYCRFPLQKGTDAVDCPACRASHHLDCWGDGGGCAVVGCAAGRAPAGPSSVPASSVGPVAAGARAAPTPPSPNPSRTGSQPLARVLALSILALSVAAAGAAVVITSTNSSGNGHAALARPHDPATAIPPPGTSEVGGVPGWPAAYAGYTVALASDINPLNAIGTAERARAAGLPRVGVVRSSRYTSLRPGYWFVFAGSYATAASADAHVAAARAAGFTDAYARRVAR